MTRDMFTAYMQQEKEEQNNIYILNYNSISCACGRIKTGMRVFSVILILVVYVDIIFHFHFVCTFMSRILLPGALRLTV